MFLIFPQLIIIILYLLNKNLLVLKHLFQIFNETILLWARTSNVPMMLILQKNKLILPPPLYKNCSPSHKMHA